MPVMPGVLTRALWLRAVLPEEGALLAFAPVLFLTAALRLKCE